MKDVITHLRSFLYIILYEKILKKVRFGPRVQIKCRLKIKGQGKVYIGADCSLEADPWGAEYVTIYTHRPEASVIIGNNVILRATRIGSHLRIEIKDGAVIESASVFDSDFHNIDSSRRDEDFNIHDRPVIVGESAYIGCECICSKGTRLGSNTILFPGTVLGTKSIPDGSTANGNPAKICVGGNMPQP